MFYYVLLCIMYSVLLGIMYYYVLCIIMYYVLLCIIMYFLSPSNLRRDSLWQYVIGVPPTAGRLRENT